MRTRVLLLLTGIVTALSLGSVATVLVNTHSSTNNNSKAIRTVLCYFSNTKGHGRTAEQEKIIKTEFANALSLINQPPC